jgi:hypothetical protein
MTTTIANINGINYLIYIKAELEDGNVKCFSVLAFEQINPDVVGQRFLTELISNNEDRELCMLW